MRPTSKRKQLFQATVTECMSQFIYRYPQTCARCLRHYTTNRLPNYSGWWSSMLEQPLHSTDVKEIGTNNALLPKQHDERQRVVIPFGQESTTTTVAPPEPAETKAKSYVELEGKRIPIPERPPTPDNCCMSGCAHCVWDLYQDDMEEYREKKQSLRNRLIAAKAVVPPELLPKHAKGGDATDDLDPGMKAFLEMEKKLQGR